MKARSAAPPPTSTYQKKRSYLNAEEKAASSGTCDLQNAIDYMDLSAGKSDVEDHA